MLRERAGSLRDPGSGECWKTLDLGKAHLGSGIAAAAARPADAGPPRHTPVRPLCLVVLDCKWRRGGGDMCGGVGDAKFGAKWQTWFLLEGVYRKDCTSAARKLQPAEEEQEVRGPSDAKVRQCWVPMMLQERTKQGSTLPFCSSCIRAQVREACKLRSGRAARGMGRTY